jgi:hypothetical protein
MVFKRLFTIKNRTSSFTFVGFHYGISGVAEFKYETVSESFETSFKILRNHTAIQQRLNLGKTSSPDRITRDCSTSV